MVALLAAFRAIPQTSFAAGRRRPWGQMVEMALDMLSTKKLVELDVDRRATLVSNLMVVRCSERDKKTQPVVNAGAPPQ